MKKIYILAVLFLGVLSSTAQIRFNSKVLSTKGEQIICPGNMVDANTYVPPPPEYYEYLKNPRARIGAAKSTFIVNYRGFSDAAKNSFQRAVDIWASLISSPVPIRVEAIYRKIPKPDANSIILGQAGPNDYRLNFNGAQKAFTWYPVALAEKIANDSLNSNSEPDIVADFNSDVNWYFDKGDNVVPAGQFDFVAIVLHELCHGLGFTSTFRANNSQGAWGDQTVGGATYPRVYDYLVVNGNDQSLLNTTLFRNPSGNLRSQLVSNNLFYDSPLARAVNNNNKPKIFAPSTYQGGSSISHLDDDTYRPGDPNALMTSAASQREIIRNPGPIVMNLMAEMGWKGTSVLHTPKLDIEDKTKPVTFTATIKSDTTLRANTLKVFYTENDTLFANAKSVDLRRVGTTDNYEASIPARNNDRTIRYYITAQDASNRTFTNPPEATPANRPKYFWGFDIKDDKTPPEIEHYPRLLATSKDTINIVASAIDNLEAGINSVVVEYSVNGVNKTPITLKRFETSDLYFTENTFGKLANGDQVKYRIIATDNSKAKNRAILPATGFFDLVIADFNPTAVKSYKNDFNGTVTDFAGVGFNINQPEGFSNPAIHSIHPYTNGSGANFESNFIMNLLKPITIDDDTATIKFDEVALVEPGEDGASFGDTEFWDYVVVEGSLDGRTWVPFEDGWDCNAYTDWRNAWNSNLVGVAPDINSRATGRSNLFKKRTIDMLNSGYFQAGDKVYVRFRLYADQYSNGWGWAIDNLEIQVPPPPPVLSNEEELPTDEATISPNPTPDELNIKAVLNKPGKVLVEFFNIRGMKVMEKEYNSSSRAFAQRIDLRDFKNGFYLVKINTDNGIMTRRFVVEK